MALRRGYTLIELVVYMAVFALVGLVIASIYSMTQKTHRTTAAAYAVTGQADTAMQWIRQDLEDTALGSLRVYGGNAASTLRPACSMVSCRTASSDSAPGTLRVSEYGVPLWTKHVFYALHSQPGELAGELVRWEVDLTSAEQDRLPKVTTMPATFAQVVSPRVLLHHVLAPTENVKGLGGLANETFTASSWGGFRVQFVRRAGGENGQESLSDVNPCQNQASAPDNTRLVELELVVAEPSMSAPNLYTARFRVTPRY